MEKLNLGVQAYSVRKSCEKDLRGTLKKIREIGYAGVEFFGGFYWSAQEVKEAARDAGLTVIGWHIHYAAIDTPQIYATIAYAQVLDLQYLTVAMLPEDMRRDAAAWRESAKKLNAAAKILNAYGITLGFHNHAAEFVKVEGDKTGWDILMEETDPSITGQIDNGNALSGGADALKYIKKYPKRAYTWHMKPYSLETGFATMIGEDSIDWRATIGEIRAQGVTAWHIVEYDCPEKYPEFDGIRRCHDAIRAMGE